MMETDAQFMIKILDELEEKDMCRFKCWLNTNGLNEEKIPQSKLQDINAERMAKLLMYHYFPKHLEALQQALDAIPKKKLVEKVSIKIDAAEQEHENQIEEVDDAPAEKLKFSELPSYKGEFRLSDMEDYATNNQDLLIKDLKEHLEPSAFKKLEEELARRTLKNAFMFTGPQYYTLLINQDLKCFFDNVTSGKKSQKVPSKILDILFFPNNSKRKRDVVDEDKIHSNLLFAQQMSHPRDKKPIPSSPSRSTGEQKPSDERKELPANKEKADAQIFKEDIFTMNDHGSEVKRQESLANNEKNIHISTQNPSTDEEGAGDYWKELPANKQKQISKVGTFAEYLDIDCDEQEPVYESKKDAVTFTFSKKTDKEVPENERYEVLVRAIRKRYEEKRYCFDLICIRQHKKYYCFIVQDVLLFRLAEETEYRILRSLQDKDLTPKGKLKKNVEFELQFNMAILGIQSSELISDNTFQIVKADCFSKSEEFLEKIVSVIVLPVLALYKRVKLDTLQSLGATKDILLPRVEQQMATQMHVHSA